MTSPAAIVLHDLVRNGDKKIEQELFDIEKILQYPALHHLYANPSALLPVDGKPALSYLLEALQERNLVDSTYIITNPSKYKYYERWALGSGVFPASRVFVIGGSSSLPEKEQLRMAFHLLSSLGVGNDDQTLWISTAILYDSKFWTKLVPDLFQLTSKKWLFFFSSPDLNNFPPLVQCGKSDFLALLTPQIAPSPKDFETITSKNNYSSEKSDQISSWTSRSFTLETYVDVFMDRLGLGGSEDSQNVLETRAYARIGLAGNPSDGFFGKTLAILIDEFYATIWLVPNASNRSNITILSNGLLDPVSFPSMDAVSAVAEKDGYYGATRLIWATLFTFTKFCRDQSISLDITGRQKGFTIAYHTIIPRQVGLAGSSALVTALIKALVKWYAISESAMPIAIQSNLALDVERHELGISAGYQDRVIQAFGGMVYMDFDESILKSQGYGLYEELPLSLLNFGLWIAYCMHPKESGAVHSDIKARFQQGDTAVIEAMKRFASFAEQAKIALISGKGAENLPDLFDANFDTRRALYGDAVLRQDNINMISIARKWGHSAKFSGSGGCVVGMWNSRKAASMSNTSGSPMNQEICTSNMISELQRGGYVFTWVHPINPSCCQ